MTDNATTTTENEVVVSEEIEWETSEGVRKIADFLRGRKGMPIRQAIELGKRVEYFKGDKLCTFLFEYSSKIKYIPDMQDKSDAIKVGRALLQQGYIHKSDRSSKNKKELTPSQNHTFTPDGYYTWMYDGSKTLRNIMTAGLIIGFLGITCFPIWPQWAKVALWYISVTFLGLIIIFTILRLFLFFILWMLGMELWIFPNIFDDNLSVADSFKPTYSYKKSDPSERIYRAAAIVCFFAFTVWVYNQPTDFDDYLALTKQFTDDVYSGKILTDYSQKSKENVDKVHVPSLEDLMKEDDHDMFAEIDPEQVVDQYMDDKLEEEIQESKSNDNHDDNDDAIHEELQNTKDASEDINENRDNNKDI